MKISKLNILLATSIAASSPVTDAFAFTSKPYCDVKSSSFRSNKLSRTSSDFSSVLFQQNGDFDSYDTNLNTVKESKRNRSLQFASKVLNRLSDTMTPAGLGDEKSMNDNERPLVAGLWDGGPKRMFIVLTCLMTWKYIRAKFLLKQKFTDKQPAWGHVITSADQEEVLHAWTCRECGTTMFIAKGREIRFFNRFVECYNCGAKGKDSFYDRRSEIVENDDTDFEYENPMDYVSKAERKKMEKEKQKQDAMKATAQDVEIVTETPAEVDEVEEEPAAVEVEEEPAAVEAEENYFADEVPETDASEAPVVEEEPAPKKKPAAKKTVKKPVAKKNTEDDLDVLGLDL